MSPATPPYPPNPSAPHWATQHPTAYSPAPQPLVKPSRRKAWLTHGAVGVVALFLGAAAGGGGAEANGNAAANPAATVTATAKAAAAPAPTVTATKTVTAKPPKPKGPATTIAGDGEYLVGTDMQAGTYRTAGPDNSVLCYWERAKDSTGDFNSIIANNNLQGSGRATVRKGEVFKTTGCQKWAKVG
ncbi:hypothetical protein ACSHXN_46970 (plasmid) [Streptomyces sp. HUAS TT11]|uniref:hypothetical protein n=1 Tax=Streptomyces sp. HUAS TT11 TaxID=3447508 RepID=UPI003F654D0F